MRAQSGRPETPSFCLSEDLGEEADAAVSVVPGFLPRALPEIVDLRKWVRGEISPPHIVIISKDGGHGRLVT